MHSVRCQAILTLLILSGNRRESAHIWIMSPDDKLFCASVSHLSRKPVNKMQWSEFDLIRRTHSNQKCSTVKAMRFSWKWVEKRISFELSAQPPLTKQQEQHKYRKQLNGVQMPFPNSVNLFQPPALVEKKHLYINTVTIRHYTLRKKKKSE